MALSRYIQSERLNLLGNPLLKDSENFPWDEEELTFEYEIGLAPEFELNLEAPNKIVRYVVKADDELFERQINRIQKQFGTRKKQQRIPTK